MKRELNQRPAKEYRPLVDLLSNVLERNESLEWGTKLELQLDLEAMIIVTTGKAPETTVTPDEIAEALRLTNFYTATMGRRRAAFHYANRAIRKFEIAEKKARR